MPPVLLDATFSLAPMEGVTDHVVRDTITSLGGVAYCVSEFIRVSENVVPPKVFLRECPELERGARTSCGVPVHVQLLGGDPERMARSARVAVECGATAIDLNFGCPAPTVNRHDGGATLLKDPRRVEAVTRAVRNAAPANVSVSAKVRLGWSDDRDIEAIARAAESGGAAWLTVHARTRAQGYAPPANWAGIARAARAIAIPVVANGDVCTPDDVRRCHEITGCTRFMIGRGGIARPDTFRVLAGFDHDFATREWRLAVLGRFVAASLGVAPGREVGTLARLKQWLRAMAEADQGLRAVFDIVKRCTDLSVALGVMDDSMGSGALTTDVQSSVA